MPATISLLRNKFEEEAVTFGYPRQRVFRRALETGDARVLEAWLGRAAEWRRRIDA